MLSAFWKTITALGSYSGLKYAFKAPPDLPVCHTRIIHEARGFPWNDQVGVHPLADGRLEITKIKAPESKII